MTAPPTAPEPLAEDLRLLRYSPEERTAFLEFRRYHYGNTSVLAEPAYVDWLFGAGAPGSGEAGAPLWLCRDAERVVGAQGMIRVALKVGEATVPASWMIDFAVREEVRKKGVGSALGERSRKDGQVRLVLEGTPAAVRIAVRAGYKALGDIPLWVKPLRFGDYRGSRSGEPLKALALRAASPVLRLLEWRGLRKAVREGLTLEPTAAFDERVDRLWQTCSAELPVACPRDLAFLSWRFGGYPDRGRYRIHWLQRGAETVGYAVLRLGEHHGARAGYLIDFLCPRALLPALLARAVEIFRREEVAVICCMHLGPGTSAAFRSLGFFQRSSGWPFMVRTVTATPEQAAKLEDPNQWFVTASDSNVDRPREGG